MAQNVPTVVGSHSSFYGPLFTGGVLTVIAVAIALGVTLALFAWRGFFGGRRQAAACGIVLSLIVVAYSETLYSFGLPCMVIFLYLGSVVRTGWPRMDSTAPKQPWRLLKECNRCKSMIRQRPLPLGSGR